MKQTVYSILPALVLTAGVALAEEVLVREAFEYDPETGTGFRDGDTIDLYTDWTGVQGDAEISILDSWSGFQSLWLKPGEPIAHVVRFVPSLDHDRDTVWVAFRVLPSVGSGEDTETAVSVFGAKVGFLDGEIVAFDGIGGKPVAIGMDLIEDEWLYLVFEVVDPLWRLHDEADGPTAWFGLDDVVSPALHWFGDEASDVFIDDLIVVAGGSDNPFHRGDDEITVDDDNDNAPPDQTDDSNLVAGGDHEKEQTLLKAQDPEPVSEMETSTAAAVVTIYVDGDSGSDSNDGRTPWTAKATIGAAIAAVADGGTVILAPSQNTLLGGPISTGGKHITLRTSGPVVVR